MRKTSHTSLRRFEAQHAGVASALEVGAAQLLRELEDKYGVEADVDFDSENSRSPEENLQHRFHQFVDSINRLQKTSLSSEDAAKFFHAFLARGNTTRQSVSHLLEFTGEVDRWCGLLEVLAEAAGDPEWSKLLYKMPNDVRQKFNECTDVSYLEKELVPFIAPQTMQRGNQVKVKIQFTLTRGPVSRFIGAICETCAIEPIDHHPNMAFVTFSQPATNEMYVNSFMGGCVLIETRTKTGERALVLRGINPQLRLLNKVDTGDFYRTFLHYVVEHVAGPLGIKQILAPYETLSGQGFSNRPLIHLLFKHHHRDNHHIVELDENYGTRYNDRDIHDKCIRIWSASQAPH